MIARHDDRSLAMSRVICRLVTDGTELGEVRTETVIVDGAERAFKIMPSDWIGRLLIAAERGAFERMSEDRIVERMFAPPVPS